MSVFLLLTTIGVLQINRDYWVLLSSRIEIRVTSPREYAKFLEEKSLAFGDEYHKMRAFNWFKTLQAKSEGEEKTEEDPAKPTDMNAMFQDIDFVQDLLGGLPGPY